MKDKLEERLLRLEVLGEPRGHYFDGGERVDTAYKELMQVAKDFRDRYASVLVSWRDERTDMLREITALSSKRGAR